MKKAFIYRRGGLGDTLSVFPLFEILKNEGYHVSASGHRDYLRLAIEAGWIDRIVSEPSTEEFDLKIIIGINGGIYPFPEKREWIVEYYLKRAGLSGKKFSKILPLEERNLNGAGLFKDRIIIHPSSGSRKKNLPARLFLNLKEIFPDALFVAGEADHWLSGYVTPFYLDHDIIKTASLLKRVRLFIGADSGLAHLSAYLGIETIIIYGPTDPVVWRPVGKRVIQIRASDCKPCFPDICPERHCLDDEDNRDKILSIIKGLRL